jgi:hypothetical protein
MSLSLMAEAKNNKRQRTGDIDQNEWHVFIGTDAMQTTVCYFGASIPCGGQVTSDQWDQFVEKNIATKLGAFAPPCAPPPHTHVRTPARTQTHTLSHSHLCGPRTIPTYEMHIG